MRRPNILLIVSDQHRADWMGCAGNAFVDTPHLDGLAARGTRFTNAYCNYPLCAPSRMSMMTGRHPYRLGIYINEHCLSSDIPTFAHALGLAGYETALCGRMHFMGPDQRHGFRERLVGDICCCYIGGPGTNYGEIEGSASNMAKAIRFAQPGTSPVLQYDEAVTAAAEAWLRARPSSPQPAFLTVGFYGPHHPFTAPPDLYAEARRRMEGRDAPLPHLENPPHPFLLKRLERGHDVPATAERVAEVRANYAGMISQVDRLVGRVLDAARTLEGETLVVYVSDHGESAGDHGLFGKGSFFESSIRVPMIVAPLESGAGAAGPGRTFEDPVSLLDLAPTLADLGGGPPLPLQDGRSLAPVVRGDPVDPATWRERPILAEQELVFLSPIYDPIRMVRRGRWKLIYYHGMSPVHLFDLASDPDEQVNRAGDPDCAGVRAELLREVFAGWDPEGLKADALAKGRDLNYMWKWGRDIGMGPLELWKQPPFDRP